MSYVVPPHLNIMANFGKLQVRKMSFKMYQKKNPHIPKIWRAHFKSAMIYFEPEVQYSLGDAHQFVRLPRE